MSPGGLGLTEANFSFLFFQVMSELLDRFGRARVLPHPAPSRCPRSENGSWTPRNSFRPRRPRNAPRARSRRSRSWRDRDKPKFCSSRGNERKRKCGLNFFSNENSSQHFFRRDEKSSWSRNRNRKWVAPGEFPPLGILSHFTLYPRLFYKWKKTVMSPETYEKKLAVHFL